MNQNKTSIDPLLGKPHDHISGIIDSDRPPVSEILKKTDGKVRMSKEKADNLQKLTSTPEKRGNTVSRKGLAFAVAVTALAGAWGAGKIAPDGEAPYPGNMPAFSEDLLQDEYAENPEDFTIQGGQIVRLGTEEIDPPLNPLEMTPGAQVAIPAEKVEAGIVPTSPQVTNPAEQQEVHSIQTP